MCWLYRKWQTRDYWSVGFFSPDGEWHEEGDYPKDQAAARVNYLNGGEGKLF